MLEVMEKLEKEYGFRRFRIEDRPMVDEYAKESIFFDLSFTNFWAWEPMFHYRFRMIGRVLVIVYMNLDQELCVILLPGHQRDLRESLTTVRDWMSSMGHPAVFEYVPEAWISLYESTGLSMEVVFDRDWSDYVYQVSDFVHLEGGENKSKRRELKLAASYGEMEFRPLTPECFDDMLEVFDQWCSWHDCQECVFGCEREAFSRLRELWEEGRYYGGLALLEGKPVGFALGETLGNCACYSFQKNTQNLRGLTYFLSYHCAMLSGHPPALNWCEDMGIEGLRMNKLRYHPSEIVKKYTVTLQF